MPAIFAKPWPPANWLEPKASANPCPKTQAGTPRPNPCACRSRFSRTPASFRPRLELFHARAALAAAIRECNDPGEHKALRKQLSELEQKIALRLEALRVNGSL